MLPHFTDSSFLYEFASLFLSDLARALRECSGSGDLVEQVTMPNPPMDQCPAIQVWIDNITPVGAGGFDGSGNRFTCAVIWRATLTARLHRCYMSDPDTVHGEDIEAMTQALYADAHCMYLRWFCYRAFCQDPEDPFFNTTMGPLQPVSEEGGAAGWQFSITVDIS